jgi:hypothetical protein
MGLEQEIDGRFTKAHIEIATKQEAEIPAEIPAERPTAVTKEVTTIITSHFVIIEDYRPTPTALQRDRAQMTGEPKMKQRTFWRLKWDGRLRIVKTEKVGGALEARRNDA